MSLAGLIMMAGAFLVFVSAVGVFRFRDVLARMHALSKASTMGFVGVMVGAAIGLDDRHDIAL
ncbi:MAG: monovalent cation/H(+) antiporter subunit G, partial [Aquihabitans sp.]